MKQYKLTIKKGSENYCATVVEITNIHKIPNADRLVRTVIFGNDVVTASKIKEGDKFIYFNSGTKLSEEFCKWNDLLTDPEMNRNKVKGYVSSKQFRVKAIKLRGIISDGMILPLSCMDAFDSSIKDNLKVGDTFTDIDNYSICEKYIVPNRQQSSTQKKGKQAVKISRLVDNQFYLHNDTDNLRKNIHKINPDDIISIHYKKHGTSFVAGKVLVKKELKWYEKLASKIGISVVDTKYDLIYSSRKVIKNGYLNANPQHYYSEDIWEIAAKELESVIPKNYTLYGEILGYTSNGSAIQKKYDYGCKQGEHKIYIYRITVVNEDGQVINLSDLQIQEFCNKYGLNYSDTFIYYGKAKEFCPDLKAVLTKDDRDIQHWRELFLLKLEKTFNEKDCYMCVNKVPEEGIVIRKENMQHYEAYKLKSKRFLLMESDAQENEETNLEDNQEEQ